MSSKELIMKSLERYEKNELIFASSVYRDSLSKDMTEAAFYKALERMCQNGELTNIAKGTYHLPLHGPYGPVPPSEEMIVSAFTSEERGVVIGFSAYNRLGLTTQVGKNLEVLSSVPDGDTKTIRNVTVRRVDLKYTTEIANMVQVLEVLQHFDEIQDLNYHAFLEYSKKIADSYSEKALISVLEKRKYKKSTLAFLEEILRYYGKNNQVSRFLSKMSTYKHPKMEEIHEASLKQG